MKRIILILLLLCAVAIAEDVLFIGNSRTASINKETITSNLGYSTYYSGAVSGTALRQILDSLQLNISRAGSINAIVFMDCVNNYTGVDDPTTVRVLLDSVALICCQTVGANSFYLVNSSPQTIYNNVSDDPAPKTYSAATSLRSCRAKNLIMQSIEYEIAAKYKCKFVSAYGYLCSAVVDSSDKIDTSLYSDLVHFDVAGNNAIISAIGSARTMQSKNIMYGTSMEGSWKTWYRPNGAVITGDTNSGAITMESEDSLLSPIKCIGNNKKTVIITPTYTSGTGTIYIRYSDDYFIKNNSSIPWMSYDSNTTIKKFCQFMIVSSSGCVVDSIVFAWTNAVSAGSNYKAFGNRTGMVRVYNKDTWLKKEAGTTPFGGDSLIVATRAGLHHIGVFRFGVDYEIPKSAIIDSAKMHMYVSYVLSASTARFYPLLTSCGTNKLWDELSGTTYPIGQATFNYSKYNTLRWSTTGDTIGGSDFGQSIDSAFVKSASAPKGTELVANVTNLTKLAVSDTANYLGWLLKWVSGDHMYIYSQQATNEDYRPYLEVWYSTTNSSPNIITQPDPDTLISGQVYSTAVADTGSDSSHYQWYFNGVPYGTDSPNLVTSALDTSYDSSSVYVKVWSAGDDTNTSNTVIVRVYMLHVIDSVGIYNGVYFKMDSLYTIDSVKVDEMDAISETQTDTTLQFIPPFPMLWSRNKYTVRMHHRWGYTDYLLAFKKSGNLKTVMNVGLDIGP